MQDCCNAIGSVFWDFGSFRHKPHRKEFTVLPPTYLFSKDLLASVGLDYLQWSLQLQILPELKLPGLLIRCPLTALRSFLDWTTAWRKGKVSFSCLLARISWLLMAQMAQTSGHSSSQTFLELMLD